MKRSLLALLLLTSVAHAEPGDHGTFFDSSKFETHCVINDPGVSGSSTTDVYTHGQIACNKIQELMLAPEAFLSTPGMYSLPLCVPGM